MIKLYQIIIHFRPVIGITQMQNTARIQSHPDTLIKNFFVSGVQQVNLQEKLIDSEQDHLPLKFNLTGIDPEVLFSMYQSKENAEKYLQFVFPRKIAVSFEKEAALPTFFTFVSTDDEACSSYFHCLIYFERLDKKVLLEDIDYQKVKDDLEKDKRLQKRKEALNRIKNGKISFNHSTSVSGKLSKNFGQNVDENDQEDNELAFENTDDQNELARNKMAALKSAGDLAKNKIAQDITKGGIQGLESKEQHVSRVTKIMRKKQGNEKLNQTTIASNSSELQTIQEIVEQENEEHCLSYQNLNQSAIEAKNDEDQQSYSSRVTSSNKGSVVDGEHKLDNSLGQDGDESDPDEKIEFFIPIAFVIQTDVEYHDIFRELMLQLFESIRVPRDGVDKYGNKIEMSFQDKRKLAFADFLAHIAFLKTIPCPSFNTRFNIQFFQKTLILDEGRFNRIPNRNQMAIRLLFQILDIQSILFCWKALLFDYSLVLISSQYSLQFNIAEALKQLMFPLAWQNQYIQPANEDLIDLIESPTPVLLCCSPYDFLKFNMTPFEYFKALFDQGFKNIAICDIDGCYTNANDIMQDFEKQKIDNKDLQSPFPDLYMEQFQKTQLNILKHKQLMNFDQAYQKQEDMSKFVDDIRMIFFSFLKPILQCVEDNIDKRFKADDLGTVFDKYFKKANFLEEFETSEVLPFVKRLVDGASFQHFCDDYFSLEMTNYQMFQAVIGNKAQEKKEEFIEENFRHGEISAFKSKERTEYKKIVGHQLEQMINDFGNFPDWKCSDQLSFDWKIPEDCQRVMLFEKLQYHLQEIEYENNSNLGLGCQSISLNTGSIITTHSSSSGDISFDERSSQVFEQSQTVPAFKSLIRMIKDLYPLYLPDYKEQLEIANKALLESRDDNFFELEENNQDFNLKLDYSISEQGQDDPEKNPLLNISENQMDTNKLQKIISPGSDNTLIDCKSPTCNVKPSVKEHLSQNNSAVKAFEEVQIEKKNKMLERTAALHARLVNCPYRNVNLTYGMSGLLPFLDDIFKPIIEKDKSSQFNFYFALKTLFSNLDHYQKSKESDVFLSESDLDLVAQKKHQNQNQVNQLSNQSNFTVITTDSVQNGFLTRFEKDQINKNIWMMPNDWKTRFGSIRKSHQYILIKVKLANKFEDFEEKLSNTFKELLKFPENGEILFPNKRFNDFLRVMTLSQKHELVKILKSCNISYDMIQLKIIEQQIQAETDNKDKKGKKQLSLDDTICKECNLHELVNQRNELKKEEELKQLLKASIRTPTQVSQDNLRIQSDKVKEKINQNKIEKEQRGFLSKLFEREKKTEKEKKMSVKVPGKEGAFTTLEKEKITAKQLDRRTSHNLPEKTFLIAKPYKKDHEETKANSQDSSKKVGLTNTFGQTDSTNSHNDLRASAEYDGTPQVEIDFRINASQVVDNELKQSDIFQHQVEIQSIIDPQDDLKDYKCYTADKKSQKLLKLIINFFRDSKEHMELTHRPVKNDLLHILQDKLIQIHEKALKLEKTELIFESAFNTQEEIVKQCFWLNILNFMTLYKLAEIKLTKPEVLRKMNNHAMWNSFMLNNRIVISGVPLSQYLIFHSILRQKQELPQLSLICTPTVRKEKLNPKIQHLVVNTPNQFVAFGFFLPIKKMPNLKIFKKEQFDSMLRCSVRYTMRGQLNASTENFLVTYPKFIQWFQADFAKNDQIQQIGQQSATNEQQELDGQSSTQPANFNQEKIFEDLLETISSNEAFNCTTQMCQERKELVKKMKAERKLCGKLLHQFQFNTFTWELSSDVLKNQIKEVTTRSSLGYE